MSGVVSKRGRYKCLSRNETKCTGHPVTVTLDRQKDKLPNSCTNPTYLFINTQYLSYRRAASKQYKLLQNYYGIKFSLLPKL